MSTDRTSRRTRKASRASFGSVRKLPSGRYQARYTDRYDNRHTAPSTFATKKQAEDWLATTRADVVRGTWQAPELGAITLRDFIADHLATRLDLAPKTREVYAELHARWITAALDMPPSPSRGPRTITLGDFELSAVTGTVVREWHAAALHTARLRAVARAERSAARRNPGTAAHHAREWARASGQAVAHTGRLPSHLLDAWRRAGSPAASVPPVVVPGEVGRAAVAQAYRFLHTQLARAVADGRISSNPASIKGAGSARSRERVPATPQQVAVIASNMPARLAAAVHVAAWSGLRAGELFGLARSHVDLEAGTVRVERAAVTSLKGSPAHLGATKTESSRRTVHLPPHVVTILRTHMDTYTRPGADALVFTDERGHIVSRDTRQRLFVRARQAAGRPDLRWHDLRHTGATLAAQAGASVRELQHRLGHSTARAAMIYQHAEAQRDHDLAQRLSQLAADRLADVIPLTKRGVTA